MNNKERMNKIKKEIIRYNKNMEIVQKLAEPIYIFDKSNYFSKKGYSKIDKDVRTLFNIINIILDKDYNTTNKLNVVEFYVKYSDVTKSYMMNINNYVKAKIKDEEFTELIEDAL